MKTTVKIIVSLLIPTFTTYLFIQHKFSSGFEAVAGYLLSLPFVVAIFAEEVSEFRFVQKFFISGGGEHTLKELMLGAFTSAGVILLVFCVMVALNKTLPPFITIIIAWAGFVVAFAILNIGTGFILLRQVNSMTPMNHLD